MLGEHTLSKKFLHPEELLVEYANSATYDNLGQSHSKTIEFCGGENA
jgi:hypothetical protein